MFIAIFRIPKSENFELPKVGYPIIGNPLIIIPYGCYRDVEFITNDGELGIKHMWVSYADALSLAKRYASVDFSHPKFDQAIVNYSMGFIPNLIEIVTEHFGCDMGDFT